MAKIGCTAKTLRKWVRQAERDAGQQLGTTTEERERIKALEREVREPRQAPAQTRRGGQVSALNTLLRCMVPGNRLQRLAILIVELVS